MKHAKIVRLILGDQLNECHSWFHSVNDEIVYTLMEVRSESDVVTHHIQKICGLFAAMRQFAQRLIEDGHRVHYISINDPSNEQTFSRNLTQLMSLYDAECIEYQEPDDYRLDKELRDLGNSYDVSMKSSEHFITDRYDLKDFFSGKKSIIMESFYRDLRKKTGILMNGEKPLGDKWNYDKENRKKLPKNFTCPPPYECISDVREIYDEIQKANLAYIGHIIPERFIWPLNRKESLEMLDDFIIRHLSTFGDYQDAMDESYWSISHSRLSFSLNTKMISPLEVIKRVEQTYMDNPEQFALNQIEGFIRQILGWREFMRGIYWMEMPHYKNLNALDANRKLPDYFWTGKTKMNCMKHAINQSLDHAYAHHIQRLMVTGNFCMMAGISPDEVDQWYLGIYIDAFEWVEITNTRGMSQFADGGIVATKPYCSSSNYINKMSNYCKGCHYDQKDKYGDNACPFNPLYWHFLEHNRSKFQKNQRMSMIYRIWDKFDEHVKANYINKAKSYLNDLESL